MENNRCLNIARVKQQMRLIREDRNSLTERPPFLEVKLGLSSHKMFSPEANVFNKRSMKVHQHKYNNKGGLS